MQGTPATWTLLIESGWRGRAGLRIVSAGEPLTTSIARALQSTGAEVWNYYGPTETTIYSTGRRIDDPEDSDIAYPVAHTRIYILDKSMQPVPVGVPGTLYLAGDGVARGYLNPPELTAARFLPNPFTEEAPVMYDTGDIARYRRDGRIECLGRSDSQVKVRGFRIELGEIEAVLESHPSIIQAVATSYL